MGCVLRYRKTSISERKPTEMALKVSSSLMLEPALPNVKKQPQAGNFKALGLAWPQLRPQTTQDQAGDQHPLFLLPHSRSGQGRGFRRRDHLRAPVTQGAFRSPRKAQGCLQQRSQCLRHPAVTRAQPPAFPLTRGEDWASYAKVRGRPGAQEALRPEGKQLAKGGNRETTHQ